VNSQIKRVFIVSLDGATFDVLRPLISQGYMPNLGRVLQSGFSADLESVIPPVTAPAWTSFMTGKNPNKHGIFDFTRFDVCDHRWKLNNSQHIRSKTIWQILSEKGKKVVVLNLPYIYPTYPVNGVMVAGWDAPTMSSFTYPNEVGQKILEIIPDYGSTLDLSLWNYLPAESDAEFENFIGKLIRSFEQGAALASHFLAQERWDVFMVHFQQTDWIQHKLWGYIERACCNPGAKDTRLERVRECYRIFDSHVGRLWAQVGSADAMKIVLSDHGFGANRGTIYPNTLLRKLNYYQLEVEADGGLKGMVKHSRYRGLRKLYQSLKKLQNSIGGRQVIRKYKSWADMANERIPRQTVPVNWTRTKAALVGGSEAAFIYVNVIGRGPSGCVQPGEEYESLVAHLIAAFQDLKDPTTGKTLLTRVSRGSEIYADAGPGVMLPDVVLIPAEGCGVSAMLSEMFTQESGEEGNHRHNGVLLFEGPGLKQIGPAFLPKLIDLAPTILHMLGLAIPNDMDGRVWEELFERSIPATYEDVDNSRIQEATDYTWEEAELIEQRLRGLGYVE
jgi:predicted AlkP superfamily phosphohydrolase/phosphomutase